MRAEHVDGLGDGQAAVVGQDARPALPLGVLPLEAGPPEDRRGGGARRWRRTSLPERWRCWVAPTQRAVFLKDFHQQRMEVQQPHGTAPGESSVSNTAPGTQAALGSYVWWVNESVDAFTWYINSTDCDIVSWIKAVTLLRLWGPTVEAKHYLGGEKCFKYPQTHLFAQSWNKDVFVSQRLCTSHILIQGYLHHCKCLFRELMTLLDLEISIKHFMCIQIVYVY